MLIGIRKTLFSVVLAAACAPGLATSSGCVLQNTPPTFPRTAQQLEIVREQFTADPNDEDRRKEVLAVLQSIDATDRAFAAGVIARGRIRNVEKINEDFDRFFLPHLIAALEDTNYYVRRSAIDAIAA